MPSAPDAIRAMTPAQKRAMRMFGYHRWRCAVRAWNDGGHVGKPPLCDCTWLQALEAACGGEG